MSIELQDETNRYFIDLIDHLYQHGGDFEKSYSEAQAAAQRASIFREDMIYVMLIRWRQLVEHALDDGELSIEEETNLMGIMNAFGLKDRGAKDGELFQNLFKLSQLRRVQTGEELDGLKIDVPVPFKLQKSEVLMWATPGVKLREVVIERKVVGGSLGFSFRVAKGIYLRPSAFSAKPVQTESLKITDIGTVFLTNKHLAFEGQTKHLKLKFDSLASISPYADGLELQKNTASARPFFLEPLDGWFHYNVIQAS